MNFVWFVVASIAFYLFYWYALSLIIFLPTIPVIGSFDYLERHPEKKWARLAIIPIFILSFLFGTLLPAGIFGMGMGVIALNFAEKATHPLIYFLLAGFGAFTISAPSGETSAPAMLISLIVYIITVTITHFAIFSELTIAVLANIFMWGLAIFIGIGIIYAIVKFLDNKISKRSDSETQTEVPIKHSQNTKNKLSIGVYIISIIFILFGSMWVLGFLLNPNVKMSEYFIWGLPLLIAGIGMLKRKYWALRLSQIYFIFMALQGFILIPVMIFTDKEMHFDLIGILIVGILLFLFMGLPLWFLFKKSTVNQFIKK